MRTTLAFAAVSALAVSACAPTTEGPTQTAASPERQCFDVNFVRNFRQSPPAVVYVRAGRDDVYKLASSGGCMDLDYANRLAITSDGIGGSRLCTGDWARIVVPGSSNLPNVCRARIEKKLTAEEIAALPSRERP